jgi:hypothetical protein
LAYKVAMIGPVLKIHRGLLSQNYYTALKKRVFGSQSLHKNKLNAKVLRSEHFCKSVHNFVIILHTSYNWPDDDLLRWNGATIYKKKVVSNINKVVSDWCILYTGPTEVLLFTMISIVYLFRLEYMSTVTGFTISI